jgi:hypothetical protein
MVELLDRHHDLFRWVAEFSMLPLHWLALEHLYGTATTIGSTVMLLYTVASLRHAHVHGVRIHE